MKHYFIINPAAGNGRAQEAILPRIMDAVKKWGADYEIHRTSGPGEATTYIKGKIKANTGERLRFYSCGGDGSAAEALAGLYGAEGAELAIIPAGSGNDYIRNFGTSEQFLDVTAQIAGEAVPVDVMSYAYTPAAPGRKPVKRVGSGQAAPARKPVKRVGGQAVPVGESAQGPASAMQTESAQGPASAMQTESAQNPASATQTESGEVTSLALNMINMGFDAKTVGHMEKVKNKFFIKGTGAYIVGVVRELAGYKMSRATFRPEGEEAFETGFLLAGVGSGCFSGGGFKGIPVAIVNDGLLDLMVIVPISRRKFISLIGTYHDGKHLENPELRKLARFLSTKSVEIEPASGLIFTTDGELHYTEKKITVSIAPEKLQFVIPDGVARP